MNPEKREAIEEALWSMDIVESIGTWSRWKTGDHITVYLNEKGKFDVWNIPTDANIVMLAYQPIDPTFAASVVLEVRE